MAGWQVSAKCPNCGYIQLTDRERQVLIYAAAGLSGRDIQTVAGINRKAVDYAIGRCYEKFGVVPNGGGTTSRSKLIAWALRHEVITVDDIRSVPEAIAEAESPMKLQPYIKERAS